MDRSGVSAAERACDCDESVQCPNERNPIFFMQAIYGWRSGLRLPMCRMVESVYHPLESA
jgi:hypothetical protein